VRGGVIWVGGDWFGRGEDWLGSERVVKGWCGGTVDGVDGWNGEG